jgi:hypothetical protein
MVEASQSPRRMRAEHGHENGYPSAEPTCRDMVRTADPDASSERGGRRQRPDVVWFPARPGAAARQPRR